MAPCITPLAQGLTLEDCLQFLSLSFAYEQNLRNYILTGDRTLCKPFNYVLFHLYSNTDKGWSSYSYFVNKEGPAWSKKSEAKTLIHFGVEGDEAWLRLKSRLKQARTKIVILDAQWKEKPITASILINLENRVLDISLEGRQRFSLPEIAAIQTGAWLVTPF